MKKKDIIKEQCIDYTHDGLGIVKHEGIPVFVKYLILDEIAEIEIIKVLKSYCVGRIVRLIKASKERVTPVCAVYKQCGGCTLMHMSTVAQQEFKTRRAQSAMTHIAHIDNVVNNCLMDEVAFNYRNKVQVPFDMDDERVISGFYASRSNKVIEYDDCHIQNEFSNRITKRIKELFNQYHVYAYDKINHRGYIKHVLTRYGAKSKEGMVVIIAYRSNVPHLRQIVNTIVAENKDVKTVILNVNKRHDNVILGDEEIILYGDGIIHDTLLNHDYTISMKSFYQINPRQVEVLYSKAIELANFSKNDVVLDAYCGIGTIALSLADQVKKVYGVEIVADAIENAKENALRNHIDNAEFICMDAGDYMEQCVAQNKHIDVVMVDPPRKGCSELFINQLKLLNPDRIVYISCNVSTQARDLTLLKDQYSIDYIQPVDMFPQTSHVETVVLLTRNT